MDADQIALATACLPDRPLDEALAVAERLGFSAAGLLGASGTRHSGGLLPGFYWADLDSAERRRLHQACRPFSRLAVHAPFIDLPLVSPVPAVEREAQRQVLGAIQAAGTLGAAVVTVHAPERRHLPASEFQERLLTVLRELGDAAVREGTRLGVENWRYPATAQEHADLLAALAHPAVGATVDIGHIIFWLARDGIHSLPDAAAVADYHARLFSLLDQLSTQVIHLHVHDVRAADLRDHRAVGRGIIDMAAVVRWLNQSGYTGLLELELEEPDHEPAARASRQRLSKVIGDARV